MADNGSNWFISGAPDSRWNNDVLRSLRNVPGSAFEPVDVSSLMISPDSGQARQPGGHAHAGADARTHADRVVADHGDRGAGRQGAARQAHAPVLGDVTDTDNRAVIWKVHGMTGGNSIVGTITASGHFTAPSEVPNPKTVTISATSVADPTKVGQRIIEIRRT
jgi:hypothetical protein